MRRVLWDKRCLANKGARCACLYKKNMLWYLEGFRVSSQNEQQDDNRNKVKSTRQIIELVTAVIAFAAAIISLVVGITNTSQIQKLMDANVSAKLAIMSPSNGEAIKTSVFTKAFGTFGDTLPQGYTLWIFAKNATSYFLQSPQVSFHPINKQWSQSNILLNEYGTWELHFCMANESATQWANERLARNIETSVPVLPDGFVSIGKIIVNRE